MRTQWCPDTTWHPGLKTQRHYFSTSYAIKWPWESHFPSLGLHLCFSKMRRINSVGGFLFLLEQQNPQYISLTRVESLRLNLWAPSPPPWVTSSPSKQSGLWGSKSESPELQHLQYAFGHVDGKRPLFAKLLTVCKGLPFNLASIIIRETKWEAVTISSP